MAIPIFLIGYCVYFKSALPGVTGEIQTGIVVRQSPSEPDMKIHTMQMKITPTENNMRLIFDFSYFTTGTFSIGITLPFQVDSITETVIPPYPGNWNHINCASGSLVIVSYEVKELFEGRAGGITVGKNITFSENIVDKIYDTSCLDLPFRGYTTSEIDKLIQEKDLRPVQENISTTLTIALPPHAPIITSTHDPTEKIPGKEFDVWKYSSEEGFTPFYIQYSVAEDRNNYQFNLLLGGVFFGAALSALVSGSHSILDTYFKSKKPDDEPEKNFKKEKTKKKLTNDEKELLLVEYEQLHNEIQRRNQYGWLIISIFVTASFLVSFSVNSLESLSLRYAISLGLASFSWFLHHYFDFINNSCWTRRKEIERDVGIKGPVKRHKDLEKTITYQTAKLIWKVFWFFLIILYLLLFLFSIL